MSDFDLLLLVPGRLLPEGPAYTLDTPYGAVQARLCSIGAWSCAWVATDTSPFAAIYAAKAAGAGRVVELAPAAARNRLLETGDLLAPDDLVDRTRLPRYTFFAGKGYGFLSQREPFCTVLRGALLAGALAQQARVFARGVYLAEEPQAAPEPDWDADVAGGGVVPASFLARELELCYAALCIVEAPFPGPSTAAERSEQLFEHLLADAVDRLPAVRECACATAMQQYRDRGDIGPDWRAWIAG
jgi:5'-methylthioadenosine phosphorylase